MRTFRSSAWAYDQRTTHRRHYLTGRNNVLNRVDRAAKAVAFGVPVEEVQEALNAQPGPEPLAGRREGVAACLKICGVLRELLSLSVGREILF
ncbi:hypothetical protein GW17_00022731 [Ensete ventricosum]|nr:hypothetical protein GW17_00022731 [Ensete ventricosum]